MYLTVEVVLGRDGDVEKLLDVEVAPDVGGGKLIVLVPKIGIVVPLVGGIGGGAEPLGPLLRSIVAVRRRVGGVESASNLRIVECFAKGEVAVALGGVGERLVGKVVSAVESHVKKVSFWYGSITDDGAVVYTPGTVLCCFMPCAST